MPPLMVLEKTDIEGNLYQWERIEILCFNADGRGGALVRHEGLPEDDDVKLKIYSSGDLRCILSGDEDGNLFYREVPLPGQQK